MATSRSTGFSSDTAIANAANGTFTMSSGEVFGYGESDNGKVIISKALADFNDLKVGDEITVTNPSDTSTTYTFTIGGIYKNSTSSNTSAMGPMGRHLAGRRQRDIHIRLHAQIAWLGRRHHRERR